VHHPSDTVFALLLGVTFVRGYWQEVWRPSPKGGSRSL